MTSPVLAVHALNAFYGRAQILFDVSLAVNRGECLALMGRNGAGKSTTLKAIMGVLRPVAGEIHFAGHRIDKASSYQVARLGLGYVPEDRRIFTDLTVLENLEVGRRPPRDGQAAWSVERVLALFPSLAAMTARRSSRMSGGEQQMLTIARTLMGNPTAILLDEPSEGLAPRVVDQLAATIGTLKSAGLTIVLCEQNLRFATAVADAAAIIEQGRIRFAGPMARLSQDPALQKMYLGL